MEHQPGSVWNYNTGCSQLLAEILYRVTEKGTYDYAKKKIFTPLNITNFLWRRNSMGVPVGGTLLYLTPRDMAKFGYLYLNYGLWNNSQLVPSHWIIESTTSSINIEFHQGHGSGYGYQWWIYNRYNAYTALGSYEQYITVVPDLKMIVVSTGSSNYNFPNLLFDYILASTEVPYISNSLIYLAIGLVSVVSVSLFLLIYIRKRRIP